MTTGKEALAKRWEDRKRLMDWEFARTTEDHLLLGHDLDRPNASTIGDALLGDVNAALAIKDALYPDSRMGMEFYKANEPPYSFWIGIEGAEPVYGESNYLSHAIMAALVRASEKMSQHRDDCPGCHECVEYGPSDDRERHPIHQRWYNENACAITSVSAQPPVDGDENTRPA